MPSAPRPSSAPLREVAEKFVVLLGDKNGGAPTVDDEAPWLVPLSASLTAGGGRLDTLSFAVDLPRAELRLQDTTVPIGYHRQVELRRLDEEGEPTEIVAWGLIAANSQEIDLKEQVGITARVDRFVFGDVLTQSSFWDPIADTERRVHLPVVFNPEIDEKIEPNRSDKTDGTRGDCSLFFHPESHRFQGAINLQGQVADHWTLSEAAHWLIWNCNPQETYITNPTLDDLQAAFAGHDDGQLKNFALPFGRYLPELLDALLTPFSFGWHLVHTLDGEDDSRKTTFKFYRRGEGSKVSLYQQAPGATIDPLKTTADRISTSYDISRLANRIVGRGSIERREATFPLLPGWKEAEDGVTFDELDEAEDSAREHPFVGRKWVLNEAADYDTFRSGISRYDLTPVLGASHIIRRRKFLRCLSEHAAGDDADSNGYVVQWWDAKQESAASYTNRTDPGWIKVRWPYRVLEKECGILFTGPKPPDDLWQLIGADPLSVHLRITASIEGDVALESVAGRRPDVSPNGEDVTLFLGLKDRFHYRKVTSASIYDDSPADEAEDQTALDNYCKAIRDQQDAAEVSVSVSLRGVNHPEYKIGQLIDKVEGRNLTFNANKPTTGEPRRLQIVGRNLTFSGGQKTELLIETFELERSDVGATL